VRVGAAGKVVRQTLDGVSAHGFGADVGALYDVAALEGLTVGGSVQNLGPSVKFNGADEDMPLNLRAGAGYGFKVRGQSTLVSLDLAKQRYASAVLGFGAETVIAGALPLRLGFSTRPSSGPGVTGGIGYRNKDFQLDYAFVPFGYLGDAHRFSATMRWGGVPKGVAKLKEDAGPARDASSGGLVQFGQ
jgi:hypothetical protein